MSVLELLTVLSVIGILASMAMVAVQAVVRTQRSVAAVSAVEHIARTARDLAKRANVINSIPAYADPGFEGKRYGVVIGATNGVTWVGLTWAAQAAGPSDLALNHNGDIRLRQNLPTGVKLWTIAADGTVGPFVGTVGWMYRHRSGATIAEAREGAPTAYIGSVSGLGVAQVAGELVQIAPTLAIGDSVDRAVPLRVLPTGTLSIGGG